MLALIVLKLAVWVALIGGAGLALLFAISVTYTRSKYRHLPRPPLDSIIFGHTAIANAVAEDKTTFAESFLKLHERYGPVFCIFGLHLVFVFAADPKAVKEVLMNHKYRKPAINYELLVKICGERFAGHGLVSDTNHERWSNHRRVLDPAFHRKYLMELIFIFEDSANRLTDFLVAQADGETEVNLKDAFERVTLDVVAKAGFSMEEDMISKRTTFSDAIAFCFDAALKNSLNPFLQWDPRKDARNFRNKLKSEIRMLRSTGENLIKQRLQDQQDGKDLPKDILSYIIKTAMIEGNFQLEEMVDEFMTFFVAGQETTSNLLAFTMICLGQNPHVMQKLLKEVDSVIGDKEELLYEDITKLEYMMVVLKETLRLFPPVIGTSRHLPDILQVGDFEVPAGANMYVLSFVMSRQEQFFKNPLTFDPERFTREEDSPLYAYFPFSMGPRSCIGQQFALIEARVVLTKILQRLKFQLVPGQNFNIKERMTLKPANDCLHYLTLRAT